MDDFEIFFFGCKGKVLKEYLKQNLLGSLTDTLAKTSTNIFAYSFISEHSKHFII